MKLRNALALGLVGLAAQANAGVVIQASNVAWVDISTTGTSIGAISDDSETTIAGGTLGFGGNDLLAGGVAIRIGNNGGVIWGNSAADTFTNSDQVGYVNRTDFGTMAAGNGGDTGNGGLGARQFLAVLWDDNFPSTATGAIGDIRYKMVGTDLVVAWINEDHFNAQGVGQVSYEMIVHGGVTIASGASLVDFVYNDTLYQANQYQDDGGSATIGYKNWGLNANANDVEYGQGGGNNTISDPAFGDATMRPKVAGWVSNNGTAGPHSVSIVPSPSSLALLGLGGLLAGRRRR